MGVDVAEAWDTVIGTLAEAFRGFSVEAGADADRQQLKLPAILVDLTELEPDPEADATTGEWPCLVHFRAYVIYGYRKDNVRRAVAKAAGALAATVHSNRLGVRWGGGIVIDTGPDDFSSPAGQVEVWAVEWVHRADIGDRFILEEGPAVAEVYLSWAPDIGEDHRDDYEEVTS